MALTQGQQMTKLRSSPVTPPDPGFVDGVVRCFVEEIALTGQAAGTIEVARLPKGAVPLYGVLETSVTLGATTVAIGTSGDAGKYRAAAVFTTADTPTLFGLAAAVGEAVADEEIVIITTAAAALPGAGTLRVILFYAWD